MKAIVRDSFILIQPEAAETPLLKSLPGCQWDSRQGLWKLLASPENAVALRALGSLRADRAFQELLAVAVRQVKLTAIKEQASDLPPIPLVKTEPWPHQTRCFWWIVNLFGDLPK